MQEREGATSWRSIVGWMAIGGAAAALAALLSKRHRPPSAALRGATSVALMRPVRAPIPGHILETQGEVETLYDSQSGSRIRVRDIAKALASRSAHRTPPQRAVEIFRAHRDAFLKPSARAMFTMPQSLLRSLSGERVPPPGGFGAGVSFREGKLLFRESTAACYHLLAPPTIGDRPQATTLYMTSSNRASRGCEALLSYFSEENFETVFRIWDWSVPDQGATGRFVLPLTYPELAEYLIPRQLDSVAGPLAVNTVYVVSTTTHVDGTTWRNDVYLQNHVHGVRDRVWTNTFDWPTVQTDALFWWGPIFEVFPNDADYGTTSPLGFLETTMIQDGIEYRLTDDDSTLRSPTGNGWDVLYRSLTDNSGLVCD